VSYLGNPDFDNYPVIDITWEQAKKFCEWRDGRLPSEAEWEEAARGVDRRIFPWGNEFDGSLANFCDIHCPKSWNNKGYDDGYADTSPVGAFAAARCTIPVIRYASRCA
jgi:formylglycine-generating enzyme required for sulfatase activity